MAVAGACGVGGAGAEKCVDQGVGAVLVQGAALPVVDLRATAGGLGAGGLLCGDLLAHRVLQEAEDRRCLDR